MIRKLLLKQKLTFPARNDLSCRSMIEHGPTPPQSVLGEENRFVRSRIRVTNFAYQT